MSKRTEGDIDPKRVDVADQPKRKRRRRKAAAMRESLKPYVAEAQERMWKRPATPGIMLEPRKGGGLEYTSPHDDLAAWEVQIADAFGTRSISTVETFISQLKGLCSEAWCADAQAWKPNETELNAALNIVNGVRPRNELEAAQAAQMVAVHLMQMRLSAQALMGGYVGPKDAAIAAKLARTFSLQMDTLRRIKGKQSTSRQKITVTHEKHVHNHHHQHVHLEGGAQQSESRAYGTGRDGATIEGAGQPAERPALQGPAQVFGEVVPLPCREGQDGVPPTRRRAGLRGPEG